jgi:hypothetical protein
MPRAADRTFFWSPLGYRFKLVFYYHVPLLARSSVIIFSLEFEASFLIPRTTDRKFLWTSLGYSCKLVF